MNVSDSINAARGIFKEQQPRMVDVTNRPITVEFMRFCETHTEHLQQLQDDRNELGAIRATLLVNFMEGSIHNHYGFSIKDEGTTLKILMEVLEALTKNDRIQVDTRIF